MYTNVKLVWDACPADVVYFHVTLASPSFSAVYTLIANNSHVKLVWDACPADVVYFHVTLASPSFSAVYTLIANNSRVNIIFVKYVHFHTNNFLQVLNITAGFIL